jgi:hypothetical protein
MADAEPICMQIILACEPYMGNYCIEFHENAKKDLVTDSRSRTDRLADRSIHVVSSSDVFPR